VEDELELLRPLIIFLHELFELAHRLGEGVVLVELAGAVEGDRVGRGAAGAAEREQGRCGDGRQRSGQ
jgi:hypothetical protein